jgi:hypothetical protein
MEEPQEHLDNAAGYVASMIRPFHIYSFKEEGLSQRVYNI